MTSWLLSELFKGVLPQLAVPFLYPKSAVFSPVMSVDLGSSKVEVNFLGFSLKLVNLNGLVSPSCSEPKLDLGPSLTEISEHELSDRDKSIFCSSAKN